ncbi:MAG TPA: FUSC family protein [Trebonia sp.]|nr:FUSC family protein [Trebonia sp.]
MTAGYLRDTADPLDDFSSPPARRARLAWLDWLDASDPGLMRLRMATEVMVSIGVVLVAEWLFVRATGALQVRIPAAAPAAAAAQLWALNHALMVIAMMLGAIMAMIIGFGASMFPTAREQVVTMVFLPVPLLVFLVAGLEIHDRPVSLALLAITLAAGAYARRFGPRGFNGGVLAFMGMFLGFFIQDYVTLADFGWLAAEVGLGTVLTMIVHFALFRPHPGAALRRMQRSYSARARSVASEVSDLYQATLRAGGDPAAGQRAERQLHQQLLRLNEAALLIDAQLDNPAALAPGWSPATLHQRLFDAEVSLSNVARFAIALARRPLPEVVATQVGRALEAIRDANLAGVRDAADVIRRPLDEPGGSPVEGTDRIVIGRFATSVTEFSAALRAFRLYPDSHVPDDEPAGFQTQVTTFGGWLPGSAFIAGAASQERGGGGWLERVRLAPYARIAIQLGIASGVAIVAGDAMSGRRFYWALLAAFITFMGANTAGEQIRKSLFRVVGTLVGVVIGSLLAHAVGDMVWLQIVIVLVSLFIGLYLFRINYTFMTIGITVMVSQLYVELDEFSNNLLLLRLGETAVGAAVAILTILLVLPLHIRRVARVAARQQLEALADLADRCTDRLADPASVAGSDLELRAAARRVDTAYQALVATVWPMRTPLFGRLAPQIAGFMTTAVASRHYARNLVLDASTRSADTGLDAASMAALAVARQQLAASVAAVTVALAPAAGDAVPESAAPGVAAPGVAAPAGPAPAGRPYVRSASLFARAADALPRTASLSRPQLALRDLQLLDGAFAEGARWAGVPVTDLDTAVR